MDAGDINKMLYQHFINYDYKLHNSFVYSWESDFFCQSTSGYFVECEVKISRGDFFRDFDKQKHMIFRTCMDKRTHYISRSEGKGDRICEVLQPTVRTTYGEFAELARYRGEWKYERHNGNYGYWANDYGKMYIKYRREDYYAPASRIYFTPIENIHIPNQLYFACPVGLIKETEIPDYAGLIYCGESIQVVKRAPYMHKRKQDLTKELLQKFYNLWQYKVDKDEKLVISGQLKLFQS